MPQCTSPLHGYRAPGGQFTLNRKKGWIDRPVTVPCGNCLACRIRHSGHWALRCVHEAQLHEHNCFLTLTYDQDHITPDGGLDVTHWQLFAKRLRQAKGPFRFLHCGEYGETNHRPHYHACLFGLDFHEDRQPVEHPSNKFPAYTSKTLDKIWGLGRTQIGELTPATARYTANYILKKQKGQTSSYERINSDTGELINVRPPYITMSRRPGLGTGWIQKFKDDVYPDDFVVQDGVKTSVPIFYDNYLEREHPNEHEAMKRRRRATAKLFELNNTPDRRDARAEILESQTSDRRI